VSVTRLLLVVPPVLQPTSWWARCTANKPHLASLGGFVRDVAEVRVVELDCAPSPEPGTAPGVPGAEAPPWARLDDALADGVDLVGISCWTSLHYLGALASARRIRELAPEAVVVVGGHHATAAPDDFGGEPGLVDFIVVGDGEHALRALCEERPRRTGTARTIQGSPFVLDDPEQIDWARYPRPGADGGLWLSLGRGCRFRCSFCVEPGRSAGWSAYRPEDALDVLERLVASHEPRVLLLADPTFGVDRRWTLALLAGLAERRLPVRFWAETRPDIVDSEVLDALLAGGFKVDFGLDTGSAAMVRRMGKSRSPERYLEASRTTLGHAHRAGLLHDVYLLFNHPGETPETTAETQRFAESLAEDRTSGWISSQTFFVLPGTETWRRRGEHARRWGTELRHPEWWKARGDLHRLATDVLPSRAWAGREDELMAFATWQSELNTRWAARSPAEVCRSRAAFFGW